MGMIDDELNQQSREEAYDAEMYPSHTVTVTLSRRAAQAICDFLEANYKYEGFKIEEYEGLCSLYTALEAENG